MQPLIWVSTRMGPQGLVTLSEIVPLLPPPLQACFLWHSPLTICQDSAQEFALVFCLVPLIDADHTQSQ